ncbi:YjiG family protein [Natranaerobius trueperi]|uniref:YjiG family protein n=1 Tax=Natranaerobius trueperi TaxID=759412 RepID=UPI001F0B50B3|nr:YjiG family protein [Natranaerobius trueperi]
MASPNKADRLITQVFVDGARKGWNVSINSMLPNVIMAFFIIQILETIGLLDLLSSAFGPVMALFGLPGEALAVLLGAFMSMGGGVGVAGGMFADGYLNAEHLLILFPGIFLMGSLIQYMGRMLGTGEVNTSHWPMLFVVSIINAVIAMLIMAWVMLPIFS